MTVIRSAARSQCTQICIVQNSLAFSVNGHDVAGFLTIKPSYRLKASVDDLKAWSAFHGLPKNPKIENNWNLERT